MPPRSTVRRGDAFAALAKLHPGTVDLLFTDPPYAARCHEGHDAGAKSAKGGRKAIAFDSLTPGQAAHAAELFDRVCRGWIVVSCDHELAIAWLDAFEGMPGRYTFAPVPLVTIGGRVRLQGDGPSSWTDWLIVSRPRTKEAAKWRTVRGAYIHTRDKAAPAGSKPLGFAHDVIRDYSNPGDLVLDPFCGTGTYGVAAINLGRTFRGIELSPKRAEAASKRIGQHSRNVTLWRKGK